MAELETNVNTQETAETPAAAEDTNSGTEVTAAENAEIARLKAEIAKQKAAVDKATKEAAESKRALRAKQSAEEAAAEEAKEAAEARDKELAELRKKFAVAETSKKVMGFVGDEDTANTIAECLYGADDPDAVIATFNKIWTAKEKALRLEYGKIPAPGVGGSEGVSITKQQLDAMQYMDRLKFANEHPDEYNRLMGR